MTDNTNASVEPMRLRAEPPRVTRLSPSIWNRASGFSAMRLRAASTSVSFCQ